MSPLPSRCDGHTGNLPAYLDHELGEAEHRSLSDHLDACPRCQARLKELEAVSAVLKGWDAGHALPPVAPARLRHAVLARVAEAGQRRRQEVRRGGLRRGALAASVLLGLGLPALGAWRAGPPAPVPAPAFEALLAAGRSPGRPPAVAGAGVAGVPGLSERLIRPRPFEPLSTPLPGPAFDPVERERLLAQALPLQRALELEARFATRTGVRGVWVVDAVRGRCLLLTPQAAEFFAPERDYAQLVGSLSDRLTGAPLPTEQAPRVTVSDLVAPLLAAGGDRAEGDWRRPLYRFGAPGTDRALLEVCALPHDPAHAPIPTLDPVAAEVGGQLRILPSGLDDDSVVVEVQHTPRPILLVAGHLITGGATDRVVARSTWLPASAAPTRWLIPCLRVRVGAPRAEEGLTLSPFVAGPTLRALLVAGAGAERVLAHARELRAAALGGRVPLEWSLLDLYGGERGLEQLAQPALAAALARAPAGVLVTDPEGRLLGLEQLGAGGPAGELLLRRLLLGHQVEALQRRLARGPLRAVAPPPATGALERAAGSDAALGVPPVAAAGEVPRVLRRTADVAALGLVFEALEVEGREVLLVALPRP